MEVEEANDVLPAPLSAVETGNPGEIEVADEEKPSVVAESEAAIEEEKQRGESIQDTPCDTEKVGERKDSGEVMTEGIVAPAEETVTTEEMKKEDEKERKERKLATLSTAHFVQKLRGEPGEEKGGNGEGETAEGGEKKETGDGLQLNRKQRRAMMKEKGIFEGWEQKKDEEKEKIKEEEEKRRMEEEQRIKEREANPPPPRTITLHNPSLADLPLFTESSIFSSYQTEKGFSPVVEGNNFVKRCAFSPSGSFICTTSQDRQLRIFDVDTPSVKLSLRSTVPLAGIPYASTWHPQEDIVATSSKDHPIHLWNADGERVSTLRGINHLDELASAYSVCFSVDGSRLYAGYNKSIRVFSLSQPGRQIADISTWNSKMSYGQRAIISAIAVHPSSDGHFAAGTFGSSIATYSESEQKGPQNCFSIEFPAVSQLAYSSDGLSLFASIRKKNCIACYDLRMTNQLLYTLERKGETNQHLYFTMDGSGRYLLSGSSSGEILLFDLSAAGQCSPERPLQAIQSRRVARSAIAGVSLHPSLSLMALCSGERVFRVPPLESDSDSDGEFVPAKKTKTDVEGEGVCLYRDGEHPLDNALHLWNIHEQ